MVTFDRVSGYAVNIICFLQVTLTGLQTDHVIYHDSRRKLMLLKVNDSNENEIKLKDTGISISCFNEIHLQIDFVTHMEFNDSE